MKKIIVVIALFGAAYSAKAQRSIQFLDTVGAAPVQTIILGSPTGGEHAFAAGGDSILTFAGANTSGNVLVANGSLYNSLALSGDATLTGSGTLTITKINGVPLDATVLAPTAASILIYNNNTLKWEAHALATTVSVNPASGAVSITNGVIALSKLVDETNGTLLGRSAGANGSPMEITIGSGLTLSGGQLSVTAGGSFINNQTSQQTTANFNIDGSGVAANFTGLDGTTGTALTVRGGNGSSGAGAALNLSGGSSAGTSAGAGVTITGTNASTTGAGGAISLTGGNGAGTNQNGGAITLTAGDKTGSGTDGYVGVANGKQLRFVEPGSTNFNSFQTASQTIDVQYTLPTTQPAAGQVLQATAVSGSGPYNVTLAWAHSGAVIAGHVTNNIPNAASYLYPIGETASGNNNTDVLFGTAGNVGRMVVGRAGTIRNLYVKISAAPNGATKSRTFTIRINGTNTAVTTTITNAATSNVDNTNSVSVSAGDEVTIEATAANAPAGATASWSFDID